MAGLIRGRFDASWRCALKFCNGYRAIAVALGGCLSLRLVVFFGPSTVSGNSQLFFLPKLGGCLRLLTLAFLGFPRLTSNALSLAAATTHLKGNQQFALRWSATMRS
jgi:hypothetical protein